MKFLLKRSIPRGGSAEGDNAWVWDSLIWLFLYYCLTQGKSLHHSEPQFPYL